MALAAGDRLGLCFGGTTPWRERSSAKALPDVEPSSAGRSFSGVEEALGYRFQRQGVLLKSAFTHRSYTGEGVVYEREEYLGDGASLLFWLESRKLTFLPFPPAILDYWATSRLYALFPTATPRNLTWKRALLVSGGALALLAVRKLEVHKIVLHSSSALEAAMREAAEESMKFTYEDVVSGDLTWMWSPPKVRFSSFASLLFSALESLKKPSLTSFLCVKGSRRCL